MNLKELQAMGAIVPRKLIEKTVLVKHPKVLPKKDWADKEVPEFGEEIAEDSMTVSLRKMSSADSIEVLRADERERPFIAIFRSVCNPDGSPMFESLEQAMQLETWLAIPLFEAIKEVAGLGPKSKTSSGTKSPLLSADEASPSGNSA